MTESYFTASADGLAPSDFAHGPWSTEMHHGRLLGGLAARAAELAAAELDGGLDGWRGARLTVDLFRAAPMEPVQSSATVLRQGGKVRVIDVVLTVAGHEVAAARSLFLREGHQPPGQIWQPERSAWPAPEDCPRPEPRDGREPDERWHIRVAGGGFDTSDQARLWTEETVNLVDDEPLSPFVRAAISADLASPLANSGDEGVHYINGDYTLLLSRYPTGTWVGVEVTDHHAADGIAVGSARLVDLDGPFATSVATAISRPPLA